MLAGAYFSCSGCIGRAFAKLWRVSAINLYLLLLWKTTELYRLELFSFMVLLLLALAVILLDYLSLKFCKPNLHKLKLDTLWSENYLGKFTSANSTSQLTPSRAKQVRSQKNKKAWSGIISNLGGWTGMSQFASWHPWIPDLRLLPASATPALCPPPSRTCWTTWCWIRSDLPGKPRSTQTACIERAEQYQ